MPSAEISYDADIKPPFREKNRDSMRRAFHLWSYADVRTHAAAIAEQVRTGPCRATVHGPPSGSRCWTLGRRRHAGVTAVFDHPRKTK